MSGLVFEWSVDPEVDSSDHREGPVYDLWVCEAFRFDIECDGCGGCPPLGSVGACDFGPDVDPSCLRDDMYREEIERHLGEMVAAGPLVPVCGHSPESFQDFRVTDER